MADRRKTKQKKRQVEPEKPTKEEYAVSKFLRFNIPAKKGNLMGMTVQYFKANKAVDALLESQWAKQQEPLFVSRAGCVDYCNTLLEKGIFHRAGREKKKDKDKKKKTKEEMVESLSVEKKKKKSKEEKEKKEDEEKEEEKKDDENKKKKKERKIRLEMHETQVFMDGDEYYVWIYDPVPFTTFLIGLLSVFGAIGVCMFPLWPPEVRLGVYYLSMATGIFVGVILALCVLRMVIFSVTWVVTKGAHHFWLLPNLTEDVGFFDSFKPLYTHNYYDRAAANAAAAAAAAAKKAKAQKKDDDEDDKDDNKEKKEEEEEEEEGNGDKDKDKKEETEETGSEASQENENGYEIVDPDDVEQDKEEGDTTEEETGEEEEDTEPKKTK